MTMLLRQFLILKGIYISKEIMILRTLIHKGQKRKGRSDFENKVVKEKVLDNSIHIFLV